MTLNSFTSVSLDPLLVLVSLAHGRARWTPCAVRAASPSSVLHRGQRAVALDFARARRRLPSSISYAARPTASPRTACPRASSPARWTRSSQREITTSCSATCSTSLAGRGEPLVFYAGQFGGFEPDTPAPRTLPRASSTRGSAGERVAVRVGRGRTRAGAGARRTRSSLDSGERSRRRAPSYLAPAEPTKIIAVHLTYRSRHRGVPSHARRRAIVLHEAALDARTGHRGDDPRSRAARAS